ncbi:winged helix-turn-helix transcriptional regulator [Candidatus Borrarchaeum sp.]|uniref:winged helix-turn-helix transcriptional regulator n=1 Tax=Candidatus Borrarchaeum sp. TaxID=2846742 RepID=UPI00257EF802|nr:winged helix-turn-helix transcriptional regulator [Candidatus Borrarchaeum sp.]
MKISKLLLCGLIISLYVGFAVSFISFYGPNATWNNLERTYPLSAAHNTIDQKSHNSLLNIYEDKEKTKEEAENELKEAENKIAEVENKIEEVKTSGLDSKSIDEAKNAIEKAKDPLTDVKKELAIGHYDEAYRKAEKSIDDCKTTLDVLVSSAGENDSNAGENDSNAGENDSNAGENDSNAGENDSNAGENDSGTDGNFTGNEIVVNFFEAFQDIQLPEFVAYTTVSAIAITHIVTLTNRKIAFKFLAMIFKIGDAFFIIGNAGFKISNAFFVAIGAVLRPPSIRNIKEEDVLTSDTREQIYNYICNHEGAHFREIIGHVDIGPFAGIWHLQVLEDFGFIVSRRHGHYKIFYPTGRKIPLKDPRLVLKNKTAKKIVRFILKHPGTYQNEIAKGLGKSHGTIQYQLKKLVNAKLIEVTTDNGRKKFFISEEKLINLRDLT